MRSLLFPAEKIAPEYALTNLVTSHGRVLEGRVEFEDDRVVHFHPTTSFGSAMVIEKSNIEARAVSKNSMMPISLSMNGFNIGT